MTTLILSAALKGTLLLSAAWAATAILRRSSADLRHKVWLAALCGLPLLMIPLAIPEPARIDVGYTFTTEAKGAVASGSIPIWSVIWAIGAALLLLRFAAGIAQLSRLTQRSQPAAMPGVRYAAIATPLTWGILRPAILLPSYAAEWSAERCAIAVAHERAHIARGDWFWQSYAQLVTVIFWFHPLVWLASSRLRQEAEEAVDDAVVSSGAEAASYAQQLLEVARYIKGSTQTTAVAMVRNPALSARVAAILDDTRIRTLAGTRSRVAIAVAALCSLPVLAAFQSRAPQPVPIPQARPVERSVPQPQPRVQAAPAVLLAQTAPKPNPQPPPAPRSEPYPVGNGVSAPEGVYQQQPEYTQEAKDARVEGEVLVSAVIDENGIPTEVSIKQSLEPTLDAAAVAALETWRFKPGMKDGQPVAVRAVISMRFKLL